MKKNKLYTVNKWNRPTFMPTGNVFLPGGPLLLSGDALSKAQNQSNQQTMQNYLSSKNAFGISKAANPFSKVNMANIGKAAGNIGIGIGANLTADAFLELKKKTTRHIGPSDLVYIDKDNKLIAPFTRILIKFK